MERFLYVYAVNGINGFIDARSEFPTPTPSPSPSWTLIPRPTRSWEACWRTVLIRIYVVGRSCEPSKWRN